MGYEINKALYNNNIDILEELLLKQDPNNI